MGIKLKKNKLLFIILVYIFFPLIANANTTNKIDGVQSFSFLDNVEVIFVNKSVENKWVQVFELSNEPLDNKWIEGFKVTKEEKLFIECEGYQYSYYKPEKCWSNYNRYRNNTNLSYDHWLPSTLKFDRKKPQHSYHLKSFKDWEKYKK